MNKPNVIIIYADDLGYGDLSCYGAQELNTPNIDALAENGVKFQNAYSCSAVCTPARYGLLTGEYPFRHPDTVILPGDAKCLIGKDKCTLPKIFQKAGYKTGVVGKWHLGLGDGKIDWNASINHTPNDVGFDYSFIFPGTNDRVPCVYLENREVVNLQKKDPIEVAYTGECPFDDIETYFSHPEKRKMQSSHGHCHSLINGVGRIGFMRGGQSAVWKDEDLAETFLRKSIDFIDTNKEHPFFLYYSVHQPHVPRVPNRRFAGKTKLGPRGDVIAELDWCVGELTAYLEEKGLMENTIIIFSSDNGPVLDDGYQDMAERLNGVHRPAGPLRGGKYSKFDGGARIPFVVSWKGHLKQKHSDALISQCDMMSSFASLLGVELKEDEAPDSQNMIDVLLGKTEQGRDELLYESMSKAKVLRRGKWEYLEPSEGLPVALTTGIELGNSMDKQLYNMVYDIGQTKNVAAYYPDIVDEMETHLKDILQSTRTGK